MCYSGKKFFKISSCLKNEVYTVYKIFLNLGSYFEPLNFNTNFSLLNAPYVIFITTFSMKWLVKKKSGREVQTKLSVQTKRKTEYDIKK